MFVKENPDRKKKQKKLVFKAIDKVTIVIPSRFLTILYVDRSDSKKGL